MNRFRNSHMLGTLSVMTLLAVGCVDDADPPASSAPLTTQSSAVLEVFSPQPNSQTIDEGDAATVDIGTLCVDGSTPNVEVSMDWGDGSTPEDRTIVVDPSETDDGSVCGTAGWVIVCNSGGTSQPGCDAWTHTYTDNPSSGTDYTATMTAEQTGTDTQSQTLTVTVNNVAPSATLTRSGANSEGAMGDFELTVDDPGLKSTEIATVVWTWSPAAGVAEVDGDAVVNCDCTQATHCDDGTNLDICDQTSTAASDTKSRRYLQQGTYTVQAVVTDKDGASTTVTDSTTVNNRPPSSVAVQIDSSSISLDPANPTVLDEGTAYTFTGSFNEVGMDTLNIDWNLGDSFTRSGTGEVLNDSTYNAVQNLTPGDILNYDHTYDNTVSSLTDAYTVVLTVDDNDGGLGSNTGYVQVVDVDPVITSFTPNSTTITEGDAVLFEVTAVSGADDPSFDPLDSYDWDIDGNGNGPLANEYEIISGCQSSDTSCQVRFLDDDPDGSYDVSVTVNDEDSSTVSPTRTITVTNDPVSVGNIPTLSGINEGGSTVVTYNFSDAAGSLDGLFSVDVDWGDGSTNFTDTHSAPGSFSTPAHTYADNKDCTNPSAGVCTITVTICEAGGAICDVETTTIAVSNVAPTPSIAAIPTTLVEGVYFDLDGQFADPGMGDDDAYTWTWSGLDNDGAAELTGTASYVDRLTAADVIATPSSGALINSPNSGGTHSRDITLTVIDADGATGSATTNVTVRDNIPEISNLSTGFTAGSNEPARATLDFDVAAETDADLLTQVVVDWGDPNIADTVDTTINGTGAAGTSVSLTAPSDYIDSGTYTVTVTLHDEDSTTIETIDITVDNVAPTIDLVESTPPSPIIVAEGQSFSLRVTASDPSTVDAQNLQFVVDWDDGTDNFVIGSGTGTPGEARAQFSNVYINPGTFDATITVTDPDGASDTSTIQIEVLNRVPTITDVFNTGPVDENTEATVVMLVDNPGADILSYSYNYQCTKTNAGNVDDSDFTEAIPGTLSSAVGSFTFEDQGDYPVCVRVCDDDGPSFGCDYGLTTVRVNNVAPQITSFSSPGAVAESASGAQVSLTASATDPGPNDTVTYSFDCQTDGNEDANNTTGVATCTYPTSGVYTATVRADDGDGGTDVATTQVRVTNEPPSISSISASDVDEGSATTVSVTATDPGSDPLVYRFDFNNDGINDVSGSSSTAQWTYASDGQKTVAVEVCDNSGACTQDTVDHLVSNVAPVINSVSAPSSISRGTAVTVVADASDAGNDVLSYTFDFKDSTGSTVFSLGPQSSNVATGTIDQPGSYSVDVTVEDTANTPNSSASATATTSFTVTDINVAVNAVANPSTIPEGGSTTITVTPQGTGPYLVRYDINGDGDFNDPEDIVPSGPTDTCDPCSQSGIVYPDNRPGNAPYRVLVEVTDTGEADAVATAFVSITVTNQAPSVDPIPDEIIEEQDDLTFTVNATDPGVNDTLTYSIAEGPEAATIDPDTGAFAWTPDWSDEGVNTLKVRATDDEGAFGEEEFTVTVTIIDTNSNGVSDTRERELNNGQLLPGDADVTDSDGDGVSDLDEILAGTDPNVSDAPSAPLILSPDNESVSSARPDLTVVNAQSPRDLDLEYTFVVFDDAGTEVTRLEDVEEGVSTTSTTVDVDLDEDAEYTWIAFANDGIVDGEDSEEGSFTVNTMNNAPPIPEGLTPVDGTTLPMGALPSLELRSVIDPDGDTVFYEFEVATDANFSTIVVQSELRTVPFFTLPQPLDPGTYYWRGQATDGQSDSGFGTALSFTIEDAADFNSPPSEPGIVGPSGTTLTTASATLEITAATDPEDDELQYVFEIADNPAFANAESSGLQEELTYGVGGLAEDTTHYWRARAFDGALTSDWVVASFDVNAENSAPVGLELVNPIPGSLLKQGPEVLVWTAAMDADGDELTYTVELGADSDFEDVLYTDEFTDDSVELFEAEPGVSYNPDFTYHWRVTVTDGTEEVSAVGSFDLLPAIPSGTSEDDGCGCVTVNKPADRTPWALFAGMAIAGLALMRRRTR